MSDQLLGWLQAIQIVFTIGLALYAWRSRQESARASEVKALEVANAVHERELALLKQRFEYMPHETFDQMRSDVSAVKSEVSHLKDWLERASNIVDRIETWMLENK